MGVHFAAFQGRGLVGSYLLALADLVGTSPVDRKAPLCTRCCGVEKESTKGRDSML